MTEPSQFRRAGRIDITVRDDTDAIASIELAVLAVMTWNYCARLLPYGRTAVLYISGYFMFRAGALHLHQITQT